MVTFLRAARWLVEHRNEIRRASIARADISGGEGNAFANGLRDRAIGHIDGAIQAARRVFHD